MRGPERSRRFFPSPPARRRKGFAIAPLASDLFFTAAAILIAGVWAAFGFWCKILDRVPRHRRIVERVLGKRWGWLILPIGMGEVLLGMWVLSGWQRPLCALFQSIAILTMNTLEIRRANDLLLSARRMIWLNALFLALVWSWALLPRPS